MRIAVFGGDGFIGWPASLHLSNQGFDVAIVDNLSRRQIDLELGVESLTPIEPIQQRIETWQNVSKQKLHFEQLNLATEYERLKSLLNSFKPDCVIHLAQQRAAPYSMKSDRHKFYTVNNNVNATHNLLNAIVELERDIHLVHLGTMGVYGYSDIGATIPEGYLPVQIANDDGALHEQEILYPSNPGSVYHMTKCLDQIMLAFYAKNDQLRLTDLHQGVVWGTQTAETERHANLINRFDYDGDYGTVLNRFLIQAAIDYPLTVHGTGGQTRAFIHIQDSVRCIELAIRNPPTRGERTKIFNQMTETHRVRDLAELVATKSGTKIDFVTNPRQEAAENDLRVSNEQFLALGLNPITLEDGLLDELVDIARKHKDRIDRKRIPARSAWTKDIGEKLDNIESIDDLRRRA